MLMHSDGKYASCDQCPWIGYKKSLDHHISVTHLTKFVCDECGQECKNKSTLYSHQQRHKKFTCHICDVTVVGRVRLKVHVQKKHMGQWLCSECPAIFESQYTMTTHIRRHHRPKNEELSCDQCGKSFAYESE